MQTWKWLGCVRLTLVLYFVKVSQQGAYQRKLYRDLLKNYNRLERPVLNESQPLTVDLGVTLIQIIDVDEKNQVLITNVWLHMHWKDCYLKWNVTEYGGIRTLHFPSDYVWVPDILLYNSADERFDATFHTNVLVNSTGHSQYLPPGVPGKRNEIHYDCCEEPYPDVTYTVLIRRRTLYYGLNLLIPCLLISGLALLVFLLPADSGEKISLGITVLLSLTVFMLLVAEIMPATSDSVPLIARYFAATMFIVGLSVVVTVLVLQLHYHDPHGGKMPKWVRVVLLNWCAWFLRMKKPGDGRSSVPCRYNQQQQQSFSTVEMSGMPSQRSGNGNMIYFGYHTMENPCCPVSADSGMMCGRITCSPSKDSGCAQSIPIVGSSLEIVKILEELQFIAKRFRDQDEGEVLCSEWKFAAAVVDRLCLVAFTVFSIICTFAILMSAPNFIEAVSKDFA
ncbi:neuronal acetylcholine receptor subunit alpha-7 isoform X2 [Chiloscyllium plagiosum]|uniref:neuronal acetylcholine receptor subunit alpha-7 isoform X2 n=1 Tax=Chiloscyllium plagiosum TaxID=36176 RepID=UPI001CB84F48|nr:neuronal acetylcholine receptor subunit alpha-7 isoform X2 [Chiloscyllium plagiosum]